MCKHLLLLLALAITILTATGCPPNMSPDNNFVPGPWTEANGNNENTGFNAVHSQFALPTLQKWNAPIGPLTYSAPVIGPDGVIWIACANGDLVGINPDGTPHRRRNLDDFIVASPAVNHATNEIFVVGQHAIAPGVFTSRVYRLDAGAGLLNVSSQNLRSAASPKLWGQFIFVPSSGQLTVLDQTSLTIVAQESTIPCFNLLCGDSVINDGFAYVFGCLFTLGAYDACGDFTGHGAAGPQEYPAAAIIDAAAVVGNPNTPVVVVVSPVCACGFRFDPAAEHPLQLLWSRALVPVDCDFQSVRSTAPVAVSGGAAIVFGNEHGRVLELDTLTGAVLWDRHLQGPVQSAPVSNGLRQIYVVETEHLATFDSDGRIISEVPLIGTGLSAALSLDFVYVGTSAAIHTFDTLPNESSVHYPVQPPSFGASSIALAQDGTLYVSSPNGSAESHGGALVAYEAP